MSAYNKKIVSLIKKMAEDPPAFNPSDASSAAPAPGLSGSAPLAPSQYFKGDPEVIKMQEALINLSKAIDEKFKPQTTGTDQKSQTAALGATTFGNFIVQNYLRKSPDKGTEFGSAFDPTRMGNITETMSRVGGAAKELAADGKWGPKTHTALQDAKSFASSMLKLAGDFNLTLNSYNDATLQQFELRPKDTDYLPQEKHDQAIVLTQHINLIIQMFNEIKKGILDHPQHKSYIEANQPFMSYKKKVQLSQDEEAGKAILAKFKPVAANNIHFKIQQPGGEADSMLDAVINYADLLSLESYDKWYMSDAAKNIKKPGVTQSMIIDAIRKQIRSISPQPTTTPQTIAPGPV